MASWFGGDMRSESESESSFIAPRVLIWPRRKTVIAVEHAIVDVNYDGRVMLSMWNQFVSLSSAPLSCPRDTQIHAIPSRDG